jgi:hypothetical protein
MNDISLEEFRSRFAMITGEEAKTYRDRYIQNFVNTSSEYFKQRIATMKNYRDGYFYDGYLWDCLWKVKLINEMRAKESLSQHQAVNAFWDLHSDEKINIKSYWKFPKEAILKGMASDLLLGLDYLPKDIYIFDDEYTWTLVFTHEYLDDGNRYCLMAEGKQ